MTFNPRQHLPLCGAVALFAALFLPTHDVWARGGGHIHWGYHPPAGGPLNFWIYASPWASLNGWGVPHHSIEGARYGSRVNSPGQSMNYGGMGGASPSIDRSLIFPGASSNDSTELPSFNKPVPTGPYRTEKRFEPPYFRNYDNYWHHGYWGGGLWGWGRWGGAMGIGSFGRWSFGPVYYSSGYGTFRNPFVEGQTTPARAFLDYAKPIEDVPDDEVPLVGSTDPAANEKSDGSGDEESFEEIEKYLVKTPEVKAGLKAFDAACEAFKKKDYELALAKSNEALEQLPVDSALHEFRALVLFAQENYRQAAATLYAVLAVSPGWDWTTLSSLYADQEEFARQLRKLEAAHKEDPNSTALTFLRGYFYTTCRHFEAAVKQFQTAGRLLPGDELLPGLTRLIAGAVETPAPAVPPDQPTVRPASTENAKDEAPQPIDKATLIGDWTAIRSGSTSIELKLRDDQQFVWTATQEGKSRRMAGRYVIEGSFLFLGGGSGTLAGRVLMRKEGGFNYLLLDNSPSDHGLDFASASVK